ncbi:MAG: hypothetical protein NTV86_17205 [Planctomycetota bacterium]|nr:hypothetical protein [Planctomycetota bacterium]
MTDTMTDRTTDTTSPATTLSIHPLLETYRAWMDTLAGYMERAADLLDGLYVDQDETLDHLRSFCSRTRSLRRSDFNAILGPVLASRRRTRQSLATLVCGYRTSREELIREIEEMFASGAPEAMQSWPTLRERLMGQGDDGVGQIVAALRGVHVEQEKISAALTGLLTRGEKLRINDLRTVAQSLATRDSCESAELAALLAVCESAGRTAELTWQRLAG